MTRIDPTGDAQPLPRYVAGRWVRAWRFPWAGVLLVLLGLALLVREFVPSLSATGLLLLAIGLAFVGAWLLGGARWAIAPALFVLALAAARLLQDVGVLPGEGWTALALAGALAVLWLRARTQRRRDWLLWIAAIFALIGVIQLSEELPGVPDLSGAWPLVLVVTGAVVIALSARRRARA